MRGALSGAGCGACNGLPFQSTRPRGARQQTAYDCEFVIEVSIHAPARGATSAAAKKQSLDAVSIHAPARGATTRSGRNEAITMFQSTRPRGARRNSANSA